MFILGRHLTRWQRNPSDSDIDEVVMGAESFYAIAKELKRRSQSVL